MKARPHWVEVAWGRVAQSTVRLANVSRLERGLAQAGTGCHQAANATDGVLVLTPRLTPPGRARRPSLHRRYNHGMFARKIRVEYEQGGLRQPCPMKWMDNFSMRNFTNASVFDDTLPVEDGLMEIGAKVPTAALHDAMEDWFRRKSYLPLDALLVLTEITQRDS